MHEQAYTACFPATARCLPTFLPACNQADTQSGARMLGLMTHRILKQPLPPPPTCCAGVHCLPARRHPARTQLRASGRPRLPRRGHRRGEHNGGKSAGFQSCPLPSHCDNQLPLGFRGEAIALVSARGLSFRSAAPPLSRSGQGTAGHGAASTSSYVSPAQLHALHLRWPDSVRPALQAKTKLEADLEAPYAKMDEWVANLKDLAVSWLTSVLECATSNAAAHTLRVAPGC